MFRYILFNINYLKKCIYKNVRYKYKYIDYYDETIPNKVY